MTQMTETSSAATRLDGGFPELDEPVYAASSVIDTSDLRLCHQISACELVQVANDISLRAELLRWTSDRSPSSDSIDTIEAIRNLSFLSQQVLEVIEDFITATRPPCPEPPGSASTLTQI